MREEIYLKVIEEQVILIGDNYKGALIDSLGRDLPYENCL